LDSPSGVGLSYSKNVSDYETGDLKTAADSHTFLLKVFFYKEDFINFQVHYIEVIHIKMLVHLGAVMYHLFVEQKAEFPPLFLTSGSSSIRSS